MRRGNRVQARYCRNRVLKGASVHPPWVHYSPSGHKHFEVPCVCAQVHVYLPGKDHPAHDTVRAIVKDDTDKFNGDSSRVWVDSGTPQMHLS